MIDSIHALGRCAQKNGFQGPVIGAKLAEANKREFSPEVLKAGEGVIGLQAGKASPRPLRQSGRRGEESGDGGEGEREVLTLSVLCVCTGFTGGANQSGMNFGNTRHL